MNFWNFTWLGLIVLGLFLIVLFFTVLNDWLSRKFPKKGYEYRKRMCIMTESERKCFEVLFRAVGGNYHIFPQIHLPSFLEHKIFGQNWNGAFRHIDEKSVDFILCDKENLSPKLVIELDDRSHERPDRRSRDQEVERILKDARMPILRLKYGYTTDPIKLSAIIEENIYKS